MKNTYVSIVINLDTLNRMQTFYHAESIPTSDAYVTFMAKANGVTIKIYSNNHNDSFKVLFTGSTALDEATIWDKNAKITETKKKDFFAWSHITHIGSDEVGVGDFFGPIIVVASYVKASAIDELKQLGVADSKKITDKKIRVLAPILMEKVIYHSLTLSNEKLNSMLEKNAKIFVLETLMHNKCHLQTLKKASCDAPVFVDQFVKEDIYRKYLGDEIHPKVLNFATKGESKYPAIAVSSIIARYLFLQYMDDLSTKYSVTFPLGASQKVDSFFKDFVASFGIKTATTLVKKHFRNYTILNNNQ